MQLKHLSESHASLLCLSSASCRKPALANGTTPGLQDAALLTSTLMSPAALLSLGMCWSAPFVILLLNPPTQASEAFHLFVSGPLPQAAPESGLARHHSHHFTAEEISVQTHVPLAKPPSEPDVHVILHTTCLSIRYCRACPFLDSAGQPSERLRRKAATERLGPASRPLKSARACVSFIRFDSCSSPASNLLCSCISTAPRHQPGRCATSAG